jgi:exo-beta-1,3-glucanase (GH17 family)
MARRFNRILGPMSPHRLLVSSSSGFAWRGSAWRGFALASLVAGALGVSGCAPSTAKPVSGSGTAGTGGGAGSSGTAGGASGSSGAAGAAGGSSGAAGGGGGTSGLAGGAGGATGGAGGATGGAGGATGGAGGATGRASGAGGAGGVTGAAGISGTGGVAGGPPAFSAKPLSVIAYSPYRDGQGPGGAQPTMAQVKADLMMLQPLVDGVRVYGTDGAQGYIPALCDQLGIDLYLGAWIDGIATDEPNVHALATIVNEGHPSIKVAIIGNEVLNRSAKNGVTEDRMVELVNLFKADLKVTGVKIAEADTYPQWMMGRPKLAAAIDLLIWHTYAYWSSVDISNAAAVVSGRYDNMLALYAGKPMVLGETGWPTMVDHVATDGSSTSVANEVNQARYYKEALAIMRARNLPMWMFDAIDEMWKATDGEGPVGAHWGIFTTARAPKMAATELMAMTK